MLTDRHERAAAEVARLNEDGLLTAGQVAAERKVTESTVSRWIADGGIAAELRIIEGERHQLIRRKEFERFNREEWPRTIERMGPSFPGNWSGAAKRRWVGRKASPPGARHGGKRPVEQLYPGQAAKARAFRGTKPIRAIADETGLTKREIEGLFARDDRASGVSPQPKSLSP